MKKTFRMMLLLAMMMAACVSMGSCSSDDADGTFSEQRVENYITGYKWYLDNSQRSEFRFYRNRLVQETSSSGVTSGSLTYAESNFFGTWAVSSLPLRQEHTKASTGTQSFTGVLRLPSYSQTSRQSKLQTQTAKHTV